MTWYLTAPDTSRGYSILIGYYMARAVSPWYHHPRLCIIPETRRVEGWYRSRVMIPGRYSSSHVITYLSHAFFFVQKKKKKNPSPLNYFPTSAAQQFMTSPLQQALLIRKYNFYGYNEVSLSIYHYDRNFWHQLVPKKIAFVIIDKRQRDRKKDTSLLTAQATVKSYRVFYTFLQEIIIRN